MIKQRSFETKKISTARNFALFKGLSELSHGYDDFD